MNSDLYYFFAALPLVVLDNEPEAEAQPQIPADSEIPAEAGEGSRPRPRKRQRGEGSSSRDPGPSQPPEMITAEPVEENLPQPVEVHDLILIRFSEGDSAFEPAIAEKLNKVAVLPLDHQKFRATA